jgi:hypothetical protein
VWGGGGTCQQVLADKGNERMRYLRRTICVHV